jgi:flagellar hook-associated protein 2
MSATGIYGLSGSGIDVDSMVKVGMMTKQNEYDRMYKKEVRQEWTKEAYANLYSDLTTFTTSTMSKYKMSATLNPQTVSSAKSEVATATANADAAAMTHYVTVNSMSSNAYLLTGNDGIDRQGEEGSMYLSDVVGEENITDGGISFKVSDGTNEATITITREQLLNNKQTLNDLAAAFNNAGLNIKASYDANNDTFSIHNSEGGSANKIQITSENDAATILLDNLHLNAVEVGEDGSTSLGGNLTFAVDNEKGMSGKDASVTIDGRTYTTNTNKLTVSNVTYSFLGTGTTTMTVSQDTEKLVENVKAFVDDYNAMLDKLNDMYNEQKYSDYDVLTESQKKGMTEEQIEKWEEKAKSGLMHRNEYVGKLISDLREAIYTPVEGVDGKYSTMMSLGIESKTDRGHLKIDEDKLRKVLAEDPDVVYQIMGKLDSDDEYSKNGVVQRISDVANKSMKSIKSYAGTSTEVADGSNLGKLIQDLQNKMSNFKVMMNAFEDALYKKYDKMESAIQKLGVQLGYITGGQ